MDVKNYVAMVENGHLGEFVYFAGCEMLMNFEKYKWYGMPLNVNEVKKHLDGTKKGLREAVKLAAMMCDKEQFMEFAKLKGMYQYKRNFFEYEENSFKGWFVAICDARGLYDDLKKVAEKDGIVIDDSLMKEAVVCVADWEYYAKKFREAFNATRFCLEEEYETYVVMALGWLGKMCNISEQVYGKR